MDVEWTGVISCLIIDNPTHVLYPTMLIPVKRRFSADDSFRSTAREGRCSRNAWRWKILSARSKTNSSQDNYVWQTRVKCVTVDVRTKTNSGVRGQVYWSAHFAQSMRQVIRCNELVPSLSLPPHFLQPPSPRNPMCFGLLSPNTYAQDYEGSEC